MNLPGTHDSSTCELMYHIYLDNFLKWSAQGIIPTLHKHLCFITLDRKEYPPTVYPN